MVNVLTTSGVNAVNLDGSTVLASCTMRCGCPNLLVVDSTILLLL